MITLKTPREMDSMRSAGRILGELFVRLKSEIKPGVTTRELDKIAEDFIVGKGGKPGFKGYHGFPATICASVNEEVVHGIPSDRVLKEGDIIGVDVGAIVDGYYADAARTFSVGEIDEEKKRLIKAARESLEAGIAQAKVGNRISDISHAVESVIKKYKFGIVRQYVGHGIGTQLHEEPQVPNFGKPNEGPEIKVGMALAIEPMVNAGTEDVELMKDGWTVATKDKRPSSHFENTILITESGTEITTKNA